MSKILFDDVPTKKEICTKYKLTLSFLSERMSWQNFVDESLLGTSQVAKASIHGLDGTRYASSSGFVVSIFVDVYRLLIVNIPVFPVLIKRGSSCFDLWWFIDFQVLPKELGWINRSMWVKSFFTGQPSNNLFTVYNCFVNVQQNNFFDRYCLYLGKSFYPPEKSDFYVLFLL